LVIHPTVALLTDFGTRDHYVGAVRGAILAVCPGATLVDIAHDVPAHDVAEGAYLLGAAFPSFPPATVFLAVVDPGVGSERRGLAVEAGGYRFVGPDNGILSFVLAEHHDARVRELTNRGLFRPRVSPTFHARDVFGPVAGHLAQGLPLDLVGPPVADPRTLPAPPLVRRSAAEWEATVIHVDRFGNLTTNCREGQVEAVLEAVGGDLAALVVVVEGMVLPLVRTYADVSEGEACALIGSSRRLEVAVNRGSASRLLGAGKGSPVRIRVASYGAA
jgi:S-adenosylmethionine hydrolase